MLKQSSFFRKEDAEARRAIWMSDLFLALAIVFGLLLILLEPPFVCPDENAHFINICRISHGGFAADVENGAVGSYISADEMAYFQGYAGIYNGQGNDLRFDFETVKTLSEMEPSEEMVFLPNTFSTINPTVYLLPAAVLWLLRLVLPINAYHGMLIAKLVNLLFYAFVIRRALRKTGAFRNTMFLLALMPMSLFQGASTSYDAYLIPAAFLLFAYVTKILRSDDRYRIGSEDVAAICFACAFLFGAKIAYAPLILVLLSIGVRKFGNWKRWLLCVGAVSLVAFVICVIPAVIMSVAVGDAAAGLTPLQLEQEAYFLSHLREFPWVIYHTVRHFGGYWIESFVGILGWLDTPFPRTFIILFLMLSTLIALVDTCSLRGISLKTRLLSLCGFGIFFVGTLLTMYVRWNPNLVGIVGGLLAYGGQGRYFIPVAPFVLILFANPLKEKLSDSIDLDRISRFLTYTTAIASLCMTVLVVAARYWI